MNNYKEKLFKGITYTSALFTIVFLFAIITSIFYEGVPIISQRLGQVPVEVNEKGYKLPWIPVKCENTVPAYCEVLVNGQPAEIGDRLGAFINGECRGAADIIQENDISLAVMRIQFNSEDEGKIIKFVVYDYSYDDVFSVVGVALLKKGEEIGERDYPILCESGTPYLHPRDWKVVEYESWTTLYCQPSLAGISADEGDEIGAFVGNECRGIGIVENLAGKAEAKIQIFGTEREEVVFAIYDASERFVLEVDKKVRTYPSGEIGSLENPLYLEGFYYFGGEPQIFVRPWIAVSDASAQFTKAYCSVKIDDSFAVETDEVGAFVNGECRGVGKVYKKGKKALTDIDILSYENEIVQFAVYDASEDKVMGVVHTTYSYPGEQMGNSPNRLMIVQVFEKIISFVFGSSWHPTSMPGRFGILTLIVGSFLVTLGALILAVPFGVGSAIYISEIASPRVREVIKPVIELLAGIPSVVYGLFGMAFLSPALMKWFHIDAGLNIMNASIILGIMVIPIISSMSEDAFSMVPKNLRNASYGLGANRWETIIKVVLPAAKTGVISSILLGFGRAIGETMVVIMVAGGSPQFPSSIFDSVRPMTSAIAAEMGETAHGTLHFHALYGIAVVLFVITFTTNLLSELTFHKIKKD